MPISIKNTKVFSKPAKDLQPGQLVRHCGTGEVWYRLPIINDKSYQTSNTGYFDGDHPHDCMLNLDTGKLGVSASETFTILVDETLEITTNSEGKI